MFDYSRIPVEIWHLILLAVIDVPYVLDTMISDADYWRTSPLYHDVKVYAESERCRKSMRLVCRSWRAYMDGYKHRWITYDTGTDADSRQQDEFRDVLNASVISSLDGCVPSRPRRLMFHVRGESDVERFRKLVENSARKLTILFTECSEGNEDALFEHLLSHSAELPNLRFLAICGPTRFIMPLRALSTAFPKLLSLAISHNRSATYLFSSHDTLVLPSLEVLGLDVSQTSADAVKSWDLRGLRQLHTRLSGECIGGVNISLEPIRLLGSNLTVLNIHKLRASGAAILLPFEFWTWCPRLRELLVFLSAVYLDAPAPEDHPLKSIIHWPHFDTTDLSNPWITGTSLSQTSTLPHNMNLFPINLQVLIIWKSWPQYSELLSHRYGLSETEDFLVKLDEVCTRRLIRVEDRDRITLHKYLETRDNFIAVPAHSGDIDDDSS